MPQHELAKASDAALVARFAAGRDQGAFAEIVRRHGPMVKVTAARILRNHHDAEDAFQATFLALAKGARRVQRQEAIAGWLHRTAVRAAFAVQKGNDDWRERLGRQAEQMELATSSARHDLLKEIIDEELERLPPKYRTAVVLCDLEGLTRKEAASRLGIPIRTISSQVAKGRQLLRMRLVKRGIAMSAGGLAANMARFAEAAGPMTALEVSQTTAQAALYAAGKGAVEIGVSQEVINTACGVGTMATTKIATVGVLAVSLTLAIGSIGAFWIVGAKADTVVSPAIYADREGPGQSNTWPLGARGMAIFAASEFASFPSGGAYITGYNLRPNGSATVGQSLEFNQLRISVSLTQREPGNISNTFDDNIEGQQFLVYDGPWSGVVVNEDPPGPETRPFDYVHEFETPFFYDPADGNLLFDWRFGSPGVQTGSFDASDSVVAPGQVHIFSGAGVNSSTSNGARFNVVYEFVFEPIPEPSTLVAAIVSLTALSGVFALRRCRRILWTR